MRENVNSQLQKMGSWRGRTILLSIILTLFILIATPAQDNNYWSNAPTGKTKVFTISFADEQNGTAISAEGDILITADGGKRWTLNEESSAAYPKTADLILWKVDVYCSVMKTTDGGNTWFPYEEGKQEHFCGVYLKDVNTGYRVASDFLNKVTNEINNYSKNNKIDSLVDHPHQCTEYYRNADEGWALGWCVKNYNQNKNR